MSDPSLNYRFRNSFTLLGLTTPVHPERVQFSPQPHELSDFPTCGLVLKYSENLSVNSRFDTGWMVLRVIARIKTRVDIGGNIRVEVCGLDQVQKGRYRN